MNARDYAASGLHVDGRSAFTPALSDCERLVKEFQTSVSINAINPHDWALNAFVPSTVNTRGLTSKLGTLYAKMFRSCVYHNSHTVLLSKLAISHTQFAIASDLEDSMIESTYSADVIKQEVDRLFRFIQDHKNNRVGSTRFRTQLSLSKTRVKTAGCAHPVRFYHADILFLDKRTNEVCASELKSGGNLDNSNAPSQSKKVLAACLARPDMDIRPLFLCLYANNGNDKNPASSLGRYWHYGNSWFAGDGAWKIAAPTGVSGSDIEVSLTRLICRYPLLPD